MFEENPYTNLKLFEESDSYHILNLGKALNPDDILDAWDITKKELLVFAEENDCEDYKFFIHYYKQGRLEGKLKAVHTVIDSMTGRNGSEVALRYLKQFAESWAPAPEATDNGKASTVKLVLDVPEKE